jgi:putative copper resistance protein D
VHWLYLFSVWVHILAAMTWVGGMGFLVLVVVPWLRAGNRAEAGKFLRETGERFRMVGWSCFVALIVTGTVNLYYRGVRPADFARTEWLHTQFGRAITLKLSVFVLILLMSAVHDFVIGPRAVRAIEADPTSSESARLRRYASVLGRVNALAALVVVALAVTLIRGWPL